LTADSLLAGQLPDHPGHQTYCHVLESGDVAQAPPIKQLGDDDQDRD